MLTLKSVHVSDNPLILLTNTNTHIHLHFCSNISNMQTCLVICKINSPVYYGRVIICMLCIL